MALGQGVRADSECIHVHFRSPFLGAAPPRGAITKMMFRGCDLILLCLCRVACDGLRTWRAYLGLCSV